MSRHLSRHAGCEQARAWASLALDGELSELEHELLTAHLDDCMGCAAFARRTWALTHLVRATPLEAPEGRLAVLPVESPRRRRRAAIQVAVAATLAALAAGMGVLVGSLTRAPAEPAPVPAGPVALLPSTLPSPSRAQDRSPRTTQPYRKKPARVGSEPGLSRRPTPSSGI
ncbi:MAG TPA: zf-HC2 domain-containing protein [Gaiellaceae bacterium]|jgi:hypothetical protein|nr:zf-HC2 domain-containing protein [Gaiellaceae bacterium]